MEKLVVGILAHVDAGKTTLSEGMQDGLASVVVPIDKLSIVVSIVFSYFVFKEIMVQ